MRGRAILRRCRDLLIRAWGAVRRWFVRNFAGTAPALNVLALAVAALVGGLCLADTYWPVVWGYCLIPAVLFLLALPLSWLLGWIFQRFLGHRLTWLTALAVLAAADIELFRRGAGEGYSFRVVAFSLGVTAVLWLLAASWWSILRHRRAAPTTVLSALLAGAGTVLRLVFLFTDGFEDHYIEKYTALMGEPQSLAALDTGMGPQQVLTVDYGTEGGLPSDTVSLTAYMSRSSAEFTGAYADYYLDYDLNAVPLVGRVWYPAGGQDCPVLFFAHGNHEIAVDSYLGYDYLGEYLASWGYVVVSVDHNACNLLYNENDGRAVLLLEHIGLLLDYNGQPGNPLYGVLDEDSIAIGGHSRGGEMAATAYLFNGYDRYPENGGIRFDYHYNIRSIVAVAPTVNQYKPADHSVEIEDVNYLLLHGTDDRDVKDFMGMAQYENVTFTGAGEYLKSALYIAGANHGQFNSLWGAYDQPAPFSTLLNAASMLSEGEQQTIACLFIRAFLDVTLKGDRSGLPLLTDWDSCAAQLPRTVYVQCYETSGFSLIADFEEDSDLETAALEGASVTTEGLLLWTEELVDFADDSSYDTHALRLRTSSFDSRYTIALPEAADLTGHSVCLDVCDRKEYAVEQGDYALLDFTVELTDREGRTASARAGDFATIFQVLPVRTDKLDYVFQNCTYKTGFATVTIPQGDFEAQEGFDWSAVTALSLVFDRSLDLMIDNIGLTR